MSQQKVSMAVEEGPGEIFGEVIGHIKFGVDSVQYHQVAFNPITQQEVLDVDVTGTRGRLLCVAQRSTCVIVFIHNSGSLLRYAKVPQDASNKKNHLTSVIGSHKLSFSGGTVHCWLEFGFLGDSSASQPHAYATK